jgi:hypothetical protein
MADTLYSVPCEIYAITGQKKAYDVRDLTESFADINHSFFFDSIVLWRKKKKKYEIEKKYQDGKHFTFDPVRKFLGPVQRHFCSISSRSRLPSQFLIRRSISKTALVGHDGTHSSRNVRPRLFATRRLGKYFDRIRSRFSSSRGTGTRQTITLSRQTFTLSRSSP